jgi:Uma2 family endonuclease
MHASARPPMTEDEYLDFERTSGARNEFIAGELVAMAGGSMLHSAVCANIVTELRVRLRGRPCRPFESNLRIHIPTTGMYCYPDVTVVCGEPERHAKDRHTLINPKVIVEVLSPSTRNLDLGDKAAHYRHLPGLAAFLMVDPLACIVEVYLREPDDSWNVRTLDAAAVLNLAVLGLQLPVAEFFADTDALRDAERQAPPPEHT